MDGNNGGAENLNKDDDLDDEAFRLPGKERRKPKLSRSRSLSSQPSSSKPVNSDRPL